MYPWLVTLHLVGLVLFVASHGVSMYVAFRVRGETNRDVVVALLALSNQGNRVMYLGLLALAIGGLGAAGSADLLLAPWIVASYVVLVVVIVAMYAIAASYYNRLREALEGSETIPQLDDPVLAQRLRTRRPEALAAIGGVGLLLLVALMTLKPALW